MKTKKASSMTSAMSSVAPSITTLLSKKIRKRRQELMNGSTRKYKTFSHHRVGHLDEPLGGLQRRRRSPHRSHRRHLTSVRGRSSIQPLPYHLAFNPNGLTNCSLLADENGLFAEIERGVPSPTLEAPLEVASAHRVGHGTASTYVSTF